MTSKSRIKQAAKPFPSEFQLSAYPDNVFRINERRSYANSVGVMFSIQWLIGVEWQDFCMASPSELARAIERY